MPSTESIFSVSRYALSTLCRRRMLLRSLGQEAAPVCQGCDNCVRSMLSRSRPASDMTEEARKLMRTLQRALAAGRPLTPKMLEDEYITATRGPTPFYKRKDIRALIAFMQAVEPKLLETRLKKPPRSSRSYAHLSVRKFGAHCSFCH